MSKVVHNVKNFFGTFTLPAFVILLFLFIYLPIIILMIFSFNKVAFPYSWTGFTFKWYRELYYTAEIWHVVKNSLIVAFSSVFLSLSLGLSLLFYSQQNKLRYILPFFYSNLLFPEIVIAVGLLALFTFFFVPLGLPALIAGHTSLGLGFVVPILATRYQQLDKSLVEASLDLGATYQQTVRKVIIPAMLPSIIASGLLVFIISFEDFLLAFFCAGPETQTLPLYIFAMIRTGITPTLNALSTILIVLSMALVLVFGSLKSKIRIF